MTDVNLKYRRLDGVNLDGVLITEGTVDIFPVYPYDTTGGQMTTGGFTAPIGGTVKLPAGPHRFEVSYSDGTGRDVVQVEFRTVPASGVLDVDDLADWTPTGNVSLDPEWKQYIDSKIAGVTVGTGGTPTGSGPLGAFISVDIKDTTSAGRSVMTATDATAARGAIGAGTSNVALGTAAGTAAPGDVVASHTSTLAGHTTTLGALSTAVAAKADLNGSGLVDASDIDPAIARQSDIATALTGVSNPQWVNVQGRPWGAEVHIYCPGDADRPRNALGVVPAGSQVVFHKLTPPTLGGPYMLDNDGYERWAG